MTPKQGDLIMPTEIRMNEAFPTRLFTTTLPEVDNQKICAIIYALSEAGFTYSGPRVPGEATQGNLFMIDHPAIVALRNAFIGVISQVTNGGDQVLQVRGWANIMRRTDRSHDAPHSHLPYHWSAVYYPLMPRLKEREGNIIFFDSKEVYAKSKPLTISPQTGMLIMFPSWLRHTAFPLSEASGDRISVSLNAVCGLPPNAPNMAPPHRMKKRAPGQDLPQEFDPSAPETF